MTLSHQLQQTHHTFRVGLLFRIYHLYVQQRAFQRFTTTMQKVYGALQGCPEVLASFCHVLLGQHQITATGQVHDLRRNQIVIRPQLKTTLATIGWLFIACKRNGNIHGDVRVNGRAQRPTPRKAAVYAPGDTTKH